MKSSRQFNVALLLIALILIVLLTASSFADPPGDKTYDDATKTAHIYDVDGQPAVSIHQISTTPDLTTMEEIFDVTFHKTMKISQLGITTNHKKEKGIKEIRVYYYDPSEKAYFWSSHSVERYYESLWNKEVVVFNYNRGEVPFGLRFYY